MTPTTPEEFAALKRLCMDRVKYYTDLANTKLKITMPLPKVRFNLKGHTAGRASYGKHELELHNQYLFENPEDYLKNTVGHEVAHLAAFRKFGVGIKPHGNEWTSVMWYLGLEAVRCHKYDSQNVGRQPQRNSRIIETHNGREQSISGGRIIVFD